MGRCVGLSSWQPHTPKPRLLAASVVAVRPRSGHALSQFEGAMRPKRFFLLWACWLELGRDGVAAAEVRALEVLRLMPPGHKSDYVRASRRYGAGHGTLTS